MAELLSTSEAARIIGVGTTSVKRWADTGLLDCVRTAGGHRRFTRQAVEQFVRLQQNVEPVVDEVERWLDVLLSEMSHELALMRARSRLGSWSAVAEELAPVLTELGLRWSRGDVSVAEEHLASERLARALARVVDSIPLPSVAPLCLLACVESEEHALGLALAELCLRELGWASLWLGRRTPTTELVDQLRLNQRIQMVGLSASEASDSSLLRHVDSVFGPACRDRNVALLLGGRGPWPEVPTYGFRVWELDDIEALQGQMLEDSRRRVAR